MTTWEPEMEVERLDHVWSEANEYEAIFSHRTGHLPPEDIIKDWPKAPRLWLPVCFICKRSVEGDGRIQEDGFWVHFGDCAIEAINIGIENYESRERASVEESVT